MILFHIKTNCLNLLPVFMSLSQDYVDSLKGLCYDGMEGLLYLSLYSFLSALAFTAILCSLPGAWRSFHRLGELHRSSQSNIPSAVIFINAISDYIHAINYFDDSVKRDELHKTSSVALEVNISL